MVATVWDAVPLLVIPVKTHKTENTSQENLVSGNSIKEGISDSTKSDTTTSVANNSGATPAGNTAPVAHRLLGKTNKNIETFQVDWELRNWAWLKVSLTLILRAIQLAILIWYLLITRRFLRPTRLTRGKGHLCWSHLPDLQSTKRLLYRTWR